MIHGLKTSNLLKQSMKIANKNIIVTGAGSGLGRELVLNLLAKNAKIAALDINEEGLVKTTELASGNKNNIKIYVVDITRKEEVESFTNKVVKDFDVIDGIINNAGIIQPFLKINDLDYASIERVMKVNFFGALYLTKSFLPHLLKRPEAHIVNVSSMGGFLPVPGQSIYGASKAAVKLMTEGLYSELLNTNVRVSIVLPGAMATNITVNSGIEIPSGASNNESNSFKALSAVKAAELVVNGMKKNAFRILVGPDAKFMDFIYRLNPKYATRYIYKKMKSLLPE